MVSNIDVKALATAEKLIASLVVEERSVVLGSRLPPPALFPARVADLGINPAELAVNPTLDERLVQDLNRNPGLPRAWASFDLVVNTVSVNYLTRPLELFAEAGRVLTPGRPVAGDFFQPLV
jgi:SAM-dependent methyltransferase